MPRDLSLCECALVDTNIARHAAEARCRKLEARVARAQEDAEVLARQAETRINTLIGVIEENRWMLSESTRHINGQDADIARIEATLDAVHALGWQAIVERDQAHEVVGVVMSRRSDAEARATKAERELAESIQTSARLASERACEMIRANKAEQERDAAVERSESLTLAALDWERRCDVARTTLATRDAEVLRLRRVLAEIAELSDGHEPIWTQLTEWDGADAYDELGKAITEAKAALEQGET